MICYGRNMSRNPTTAPCFVIPNVWKCWCSPEVFISNEGRVEMGDNLSSGTKSVVPSAVSAGAKTVLV